VVRLKSIDGIVNFRAFRSRTLALSHFQAGESQVIDEILNESALFDVGLASDPPDSDPAGAGWQGCAVTDLSSANDAGRGGGLAGGSKCLTSKRAPSMRVRALPIWCGVSGSMIPPALRAAGPAVSARRDSASAGCCLAQLPSSIARPLSRPRRILDADNRHPRRPAGAHDTCPKCSPDAG
jgi:hypothetical protein